MSRTPASMRILVTATPAAPRPVTSTRRPSSSRPVSVHALSSAARTTTAVPCWSSWKTGMSSCSLRRSSISKQRGAEMSSRLMPPKPGAMRSTVSTISSGSLVSRQIGKASTPANSLKSIALPSMTGIAASGPMSPSPSTAVPSETTATVLRLIVYWKALSRSSAMAMQTRATPGRVGHREVVARLERLLVVLLDLAADVQQEGAVGGVDDAHAVDGVDRGRDRLPLLGVGGVDGDVAQQLVLGDLDEVDRADDAARPCRSRSRPGRACPGGGRSRCGWSASTGPMA